MNFINEQIFIKEMNSIFQYFWHYAFIAKDYEGLFSFLV